MLGLWKSIGIHRGIFVLIQHFVRVSEGTQAHLPLSLKYLRLPSSEHYIESMEEWMADLCDQQLQKYKDISEFANRIFGQFLHLIHTSEGFQDINLIVDRSFHHFRNAHYHINYMAYKIQISR